MRTGLRERIEEHFKARIGQPLDIADVAAAIYQDDPPKHAAESVRTQIQRINRRFEGTGWAIRHTGEIGTYVMRRGCANG